MPILVNDLSLHGQFSDLPSFRVAIGRVMTMRQVARRFGHALHCHRNMAHAQVTSRLSMPQAIQSFSVDERRALMQWLTQQGPFWEDARSHSPDDYLECNGAIVTDTAVGEAAWCCLHGFARHLASLTPSFWVFTPVPVAWVLDDGGERRAEVINYWEPTELEAALQAAPAPLSSWDDLATAAPARCPQLTFAPDSFAPLRGHPFGEGAARRILALLDTLNRLRSSFDEHGQRTPDGHRLYQDHFTGDKAWFSDSSDTEKREFRTGLTFRHPTAEGESLFCTWHGKVKTPPLRIHFSWPVTAHAPLYVVYVGPKITKR